MCDQQRCIRELSGDAPSLLGYAAEDLLDDGWRRCHEGAEAQHVLDEIAAAGRAGMGGVFSLSALAKDGHRLWCEVRLWAWAGGIRGYTSLNAIDVTRRTF